MTVSGGCGQSHMGSLCISIIILIIVIILIVMVCYSCNQNNQQQQPRFNRFKGGHKNKFSNTCWTNLFGQNNNGSVCSTAGPLHLSGRCNGGVCW